MMIKIFITYIEHGVFNNFNRVIKIGKISFKFFLFLLIRG